MECNVATKTIKAGKDWMACIYTYSARYTTTLSFTSVIMYTCSLEIFKLCVHHQTLSSYQVSSVEVLWLVRFANSTEEGEEEFWSGHLIVRQLSIVQNFTRHSFWLYVSNNDVWRGKLMCSVHVHTPHIARWPMPSLNTPYYHTVW